MKNGVISGLTRRRFLALSAGALCGASSVAAASRPVTRWQGTALGADASAQLVGLDPASASDILVGLQRELRRLETLFSLYRPESQVSRLNREGRLDAPAPELLEVLAQCDALHRGTGGAFDPTTQPLFATFAQAAAAGRTPSGDEVARARAAVGWHHLRIGTDSVAFARPGGQLTLNGIAQGYISDRIAAWLRDRGLTDILLEAGEIVALGHGPDATPWRCRIADAAGTSRRELRLRDRAIATSAPDAMTLAGARHIFDPASGRSADRGRMTSVSAPAAMLADGLSTALCVLPPESHATVIARFPGARVEFAT
ncbi:ApbE family lipoprotein [Dinoroseobacter shibae DFL 12 = DSM 16493]|jgi:thiamine biosynthesis lipoprotein|uniref:FAD:protein FMN transferase n=1 Tax=Dinoroseobacter shibae (strain DSM 16493 / NCIMB 14021 / DFL 12) TaxID=398580 RepID=A8LLZ2_DINSH|nr:ApbE family lipoprotein [Dinoroseobacter shibae DFL 12 = DSM 16493]